MPCIKCSNGKWKYGQYGRCQFSTLSACQAAAAAIHAQEGRKVLEPQRCKGDCGSAGGCINCPCQDCKNRSEGATNGH